MNRIDYILDFVTHLGRAMLESGANLERVTRSMELICRKYNLQEVSIFALNTHISISAREQGKPAQIRQMAIPYNGINMERLCRLSDLSYQVCNEKPKVEDLENMLYQALMIKPNSFLITYVGYMIAMSSLCALFGGKIQDIIVVCISTLILLFMTQYFGKEKLNRIITNGISMFVCGCIAIAAKNFGFAQDINVIIITNAFYLIPGIPMVNAMRNIVCGNEMNGIIEIMKVIMEVVTIVAGLYLSFFIFGYHNLFIQ